MFFIYEYEVKKIEFLTRMLDNDSRTLFANLSGLCNALSIDMLSQITLTGFIQPENGKKRQICQLVLQCSLVPSHELRITEKKIVGLEPIMFCQLYSILLTE